MEDVFDTQAYEFNRDDERAQRVAGLALMLMNASSPVSTQSIRASLYPDRSDDAFDRAFQRDRRALADMGLEIEQVSGGLTGASGWLLDPSATVETSGLTDEEALVVDLMCQPLCSDPTFPYGRDLMLALAKVNNSFEDVLPGQPGVSLANIPDPAAALRGAFLRRLACDVEYSSASGNISSRRVGVLGTFGLRGHLYFVTCPYGEGGLASDGMRYLRADRIISARAVPGASYEVPEDFCVDDCVRLPFQMGATLFRGRFRVPGHLEGEVRDEVFNAGEFSREEGWLCLEADVADVRAAAVWSVAAGVTPVSPAELVSEFRSILEGTSHGN